MLLCACADNQFTVVKRSWKFLGGERIMTAVAGRELDNAIYGIDFKNGVIMIVEVGGYYLWSDYPDALVSLEFGCLRPPTVHRNFCDS